MAKTNKQCETCNMTAIITERFCKKCKRELLQRLQDEGYLTPDPFPYPYMSSGNNRDASYAEDTRETKYGID